MEFSLQMRIYISSAFWLFLCVFGTWSSADNFGLLYGTLRSFQAHACDGEELRLNCSGNTAIAVNYFFYGRREHSEHLCAKRHPYATEPCQLSQALKVIEKRCRSQVLCRLLISSEIFHDAEEDPCPDTSKYAEVIYKCRPESFRNKVVCEGENLHLSCPSNQRLAIYAATFGSTRSEIDECPQPTGIREECQASYATETVMRRCVGEQKCTVAAKVSTFGSPHCAGRKHLKIAYSCVSGDILNTAFRGSTSEEDVIHTTSFPAWAHAVNHQSFASKNHTRVNHPSRIPPTEPSNLFKSEMQSDEVPSGGVQQKPTRNKQLVGFMSEWMSARKYMEGNKHKLILYVSLSVVIGLIAFVSAFAARLFVVRMRKRKDSLPPAPEDPFFSDSDLEQFDPPDGQPPAPLVVTYSTIRRHDSDAQPRAPITADDDKYFS